MSKKVVQAYLRSKGFSSQYSGSTKTLYINTNTKSGLPLIRDCKKQFKGLLTFDLQTS